MSKTPLLGPSSLVPVSRCAVFRLNDDLYLDAWGLRLKSPNIHRCRVEHFIPKKLEGTQSATYLLLSGRWARLSTLKALRIQARNLLAVFEVGIFETVQSPALAHSSVGPVSKDFVAPLACRGQVAIPVPFSCAE